MTKKDFIFSKFNQLMMLRIKTTNVDVNYNWIPIVICKIHKHNCLLTTFCKWDIKDLKLTDMLFFSHVKRESDPKYLIDILKSSYVKFKINTRNYLNHNSLCGVAQYMLNCRLLNKKIQKLKCSMNNAFQLYFTILSKNLYNLSINFKTGWELANARVI